MNKSKQAYLDRAEVLSLLSDAENASVSAAESTRLREGEEYVDLQRLDQGVRRGLATITVTANVLPRRAVHEGTWLRIVEALRAMRHPNGESGL